MPHEYHVSQNHVAEWFFLSAGTYDDPSSDVDLDVVVTGPGGRTWRVPAFWAGGREWRVRFTPREPGTFHYRTECTRPDDGDLHGREGRLIVREQDNELPLMQRGPLRLSDSRRHFEHADGSPFFWLADTWWLGLTKRLPWPEGFQQLVTDRAAKGFTVAQIVAGPCPEMTAFDERGANEAGHAWEAGFKRIHPAYFDMADLRIRHLVRAGILPCILGGWGYYIVEMGVEKMKRHWRYLVARYGAYPVVWCLAGEGVMPFYLSKDREGDTAKQKKGWTEVARYVREIDPVGHPITIHPTASARDQVEDDAVLDFDMLQTGHGDLESLPATVKAVTASRTREPVMPVVNGEVCYEGIMERSHEEIQRLMFWSCMLSGAAGHTYGASGLWQMNSPEWPFGAAPHGTGYAEVSWEQASRLPGSGQLGACKRLLERYRWWDFEPHPEWVEPHWTDEDYLRPYAAGVPGQVRVIYMPVPRRVWGAGGSVTVRALEGGRTYRAFFYDPKMDREVPIGQAIGQVRGDDEGCWKSPRAVQRQDWVLVLEAAES